MLSKGKMADENVIHSEHGDIITCDKKPDLDATILPATPKRIVKHLDYSDRKNSNSDLHSRLKTRKVLGVGEIRDDRDIYRSKISQILGHSEHLYVKLPKGLFYWYWINFIFFLGTGLLCFFIPKMAALLEMIQIESNYSIRLYGVALIGYSILYKTLMDTKQRSNICTCLKSIIFVFAMQISLGIFHIRSSNSSETISCKSLFLLILFLRIVGAVGSIVFHELTNPSLIRWIRQYMYNQNDITDWEKSSYQTQQDSSDDLLKDNQQLLSDKKD